MKGKRTAAILTIIFCALHIFAGDIETISLHSSSPSIGTNSWLTAGYSGGTSELQLSGVIQPKDLVFSPVINIDTLMRDYETETAKVVSPIDVQEERKQEIVDGKSENTDLDDTTYGMTSGVLAENARKESYEYAVRKSDFNESVLIYDYVYGRIYDIITCPKTITEIVLRPGEQIMGSPVIKGQQTDWSFTLANSMENGQNIQHLFVTPSRIGLNTFMTVLTNQRTYHFRIASFETNYLSVVSFRYPANFANLQDPAFMNSAESVLQNASFTLDVTTAYYDYKIRVVKGKPSWTPISCFSDARKTYIQFPKTITTSNEMPVIFIKNGNTEAFVNYRQCNTDGTLYQLDLVITGKQKIILRAGNKQQVEITR